MLPGDDGYHQPFRFGDCIGPKTLSINDRKSLSGSSLSLPLPLPCFDSFTSLAGLRATPGTPLGCRRGPAESSGGIPSMPDKPDKEGMPKFLKSWLRRCCIWSWTDLLVVVSPMSGGCGPPMAKLDGRAMEVSENADSRDIVPPASTISFRRSCCFGGSFFRFAGGGGLGSVHVFVDFALSLAAMASLIACDAFALASAVLSSYHSPLLPFFCFRKRPPSRLISPTSFAATIDLAHLLAACVYSSSAPETTVRKRRFPTER